MGLGKAWRRAAAGAAVALVGATTLVSCDLPDGFHSYKVFAGLNQPTNVEFAPDGRVFVAEKRGVIKVFDGLDDSTATVLADLRTRVFNGWDRGILGLGVAPDFTTDPAVYVLYTLDQMPGGTIPEWGAPSQDVDNCPTPPGYTENGCVVMGRLSKLPLNTNGTWTGQETVLLDDWCQQFPSHTIGDIAFGSDGSLYASSGEGSSFHYTDYGQNGIPKNPCGDPPSGVGGTQLPATAEGGSLRAQDVWSLGDPTGASGAIIRLNPDTGAPMPGNPLINSSNVGARRIVAHGFRNPYRFTVRPGTSELWVGDVGWGEYDEIDRTVGNDGTIDNFGWPCYEGPVRQPVWDRADVGACEFMYAAPPNTVKAPHFAYPNLQKILPGERCNEQAGSALAGLAFQPSSSSYPAEFDGSLYFADAVRRCIWRMDPGPDGVPDPTKVRLFHSNTGTIVDLQFGPGGDLWYVDLDGGSIRRIGYSASNHPPAPVVRATPTSGNPPLTVNYDASASTDPDPGDTLTFAWDLDNDGAFDDANGTGVTQVYTSTGVKVVRVKATDQAGLSEVAQTSVTVGTPTVPVPVINTPVAGTRSVVGSQLAFSGSATAPDGTPLPASALRWQADLLHCPAQCHRHAAIFSQAGVTSGSFTVPDHEYPTSIEVLLTATATNGQSATVTRRVDYQATAITAASQPAGASLSVGGTTGTAPFTSNQSTGGRITLSAPATATIGGVPHTFVSWSDGGAASHEVTVPTAATTYTAVYQPSPAGTPPEP
jgi:glucose/arabinose dehydrogenase